MTLNLKFYTLESNDINNMIRRKNNRSTGSLELGNHGDYYSQSMSSRKLTSRKIIKYLILIMVGVLIHTAYRAFFQIGGSTRNDAFENSAKINEGQNLPVDKIEKTSNDHKDSEKLQKINDKNEAKVQSQLDSVFDEARKQFLDKDKGDQNIKKQSNVVKDKGGGRGEYDKNGSKDKVISQDEIKDKIISQDEIKRNQKIFNEGKLEAEGNKVKKEEIEREKKLAEILQEETAPDNIGLDGRGNVITNQESAKVDNIQNVKQNVPDDSVNKNQIRDKQVPLEFVEKVEQVEKIESKTIIEKHEKPPLVTAATQGNFLKVKQLVKSVQDFLKNTKIYVYDIDLLPNQSNELKAGCHVRVKPALISLFPGFVKSLRNFHWRPLIIQMALAEHGHIMWLDPGVRVISTDLLKLLEDDSSKIIVFGTKALFTTSAVTNFKMFKYLPTDKEKIANTLHIEMRAMVIHNEEEVHEKFMKFYVACALDEKCQAPGGTQDSCEFEITGREYAQCHKYDESALNIILKNWFNFDLSKFFVSSLSYLGSYDETEIDDIKLCRDPRDVAGL